MKTPNIWKPEVNYEWGKYCPQEIRNTFTGEQLCWLKSFAEKYAERNVEELIEKIKETEMYHMISKYFDSETVEIMIEELSDTLEN